MKTLNKITATNGNEVLCSILPPAQFVKELNTDKHLKQLISEMMGNQRKLRIKKS